MSPIEPFKSRTVPIIARCHDMLLLDIGSRRVGHIILYANQPEAGSREYLIEREPEHIVELDFDPADLETFECDRTWCSNFGPRTVPESARSAFQSYQLGSAQPMRSQDGYFCMSCCLPPR